MHISILNTIFLTHSVRNFPLKAMICLGVADQLFTNVFIFAVCLKCVQADIILITCVLIEIFGTNNYLVRAMKVLICYKHVYDFIN